MSERVLITGGAGFIGTHLTAALLKRGHHVRVLDSLIEQVHGHPASGSRPPALSPEAEFIVGDVRDGAAVARALRGIDSVVHLAAEVGVGQSMYAVERYVSVNDCGTAALFQELIEQPGPAGRRRLLHEHLRRGPLPDGRRRHRRRTPCGSRARPGEPWDPLDARGQPLVPVPTPEWKRADPRLGLRPDQIRAGAPHPHPGARLRHGGRRAAAVERLRAGPGALQPLYRRAGDLRLAPAQRPAAA